MPTGMEWWHFTKKINKGQLSPKIWRVFASLLPNIQCFTLGQELLLATGDLQPVIQQISHQNGHFNLKVIRLTSSWVEYMCVWSLNHVHRKFAASSYMQQLTRRLLAAYPPFSQKTKKDVPFCSWQYEPIPSDNSSMLTSLHTKSIVSSRVQVVNTEYNFIYPPPQVGNVTYKPCNAQLLLNGASTLSSKLKFFWLPRVDFPSWRGQPGDVIRLWTQTVRLLSVKWKVSS